MSLVISNNMEHPHYGRLPNIYYHKSHDYYFVKFQRQGQFFYSPCYQTVEEAIEVYNVMKYVVPKSLQRKHARAKICDYLQPNWKFDKYEAGVEQHVTNKNTANLVQSIIGKVKRYGNRKEQLLAQQVSMPKD